MYCLYCADTPCKYLGVPKASHWNEIIQSIKDRIASWKAQWLSLVGMILMVKSILSSILNYVMSVLLFRKGVISSISKCLTHFIWKGNMADSKKVALVSWENICQLEFGGGVGVNNAHERNISLGAKLAWKFSENPSTLWARIIRIKYLDSDDPVHIFTM